MAIPQPGAGTAHVAPGRVGADLWLRVASAVVLGPLAIGVAYLGGGCFLLFWWLAAVGVLWEWAGLVIPERRWLATGVGATGLAIAAASLPLGAGGIAVAAVAIAGIILGALASNGRRLWAGSGTVYAGAVVLTAVVLRDDPQHGLAAIVLLFAVVWGTDIAAYFGGWLLGGPKLWRRVSPKKTWSGALVGTGVAVAAGLLTARLAGIGVGLPLALVCLMLSIISQAGDLFESAIKRRFGAKDSGHLIPGHGGLMDRLDGFVAAAAAAALIGLCRAGFAMPASGLLIW